MENTTIQLAIKNMEVLSEVLHKKAAEDKYYNTDYGYYLEQMSHSLYKDSSELRELEYMCGGF